MKLRLLLITCLLTSSLFGQSTGLDSLHNKQAIDYNFETHKRYTLLKYAGITTSVIGAISLNTKLNNGFVQSEINALNKVISLGGMVAFISQIIMDVQSLKMGRELSHHTLTLSGGNKLNTTEENKFPFNLQSDLIYTDRRGNEFDATIESYNPVTYCYYIKFNRSGKPISKAIYRNKFPRLRLRD